MNDFYVVGERPSGKKIVSIKCNDCQERFEVQAQPYHKIRLYYCKCCSQLGERNGMYGKGHLLKGERNGNYGGLTEEHKNNISKARTGMKMVLSSELREKKRNIGAENLMRWMNENPELHRKSSRKGGVNSLKLQSDYGRISSIEQKTIEWLDSNKIEYSFQYSIDNRFLYDFKIGNVIVEVNGVWFHSLPEQIERDKEKKTLAESKGFRVIYIWEDEVNNNDFSKIKEIL
jgi:hypothetical protein